MTDGLLQPARFSVVAMNRFIAVCTGIFLIWVSQAFAVPVGLHVYAAPQPAPVLEVADRANKVHRIEDYRGRVVVVNFWASWCAPCKKELPSLLAMNKTYSDAGLVVLAVSLDDSWEAVSAGLGQHESAFVSLLDMKQDASVRWGAIGVPTAFVLDKKGRIRLRIVGGYDWDDADLRSRIEDLLEQDTKRP